MSAPVFVSESSDHDNSGVDVLPAEPTGAAENDVIIAFITAALVTGVTWTVPADFTEIDALDLDMEALDHSGWLGYKVRGSTAGNGYAFQHNGGAERMRGTLLAYRGCSTTNPLDVTYVRATHHTAPPNDAGVTAPPPITTQTDASRVVVIQHFNNDIPSSVGPPTGYNMDADYARFFRVHNIASKETSKGVETPGTWNHTGVNAGVDSVNFTLALRSAAADAVVVPLLDHSGYRHDGRH